MLPSHNSRDSVYLVTAPIPLIGAHMGDELVIRPTDDKWPVTLLRRLAPELTAAIPEGAVRLLGTYEPNGVVPVDQEPDAAPRPAPRLLR